MLVLTRKKGQSIIVNGNIEIHIVTLDDDKVKIGIEAPSDVVVLRKELIDEVEASNRGAIIQRTNLDALKKLKK